MLAQTLNPTQVETPSSKRVEILNAVPFPYTDGYRLMAEVSRPVWDDLNECLMESSITLDCLVTSDGQVPLMAAKRFPGYQLIRVWSPEPEEDAPF